MIKVYVLQSQKDGTLYIGMTNDLPRRLKEHDSGKNSSTKNKAPFTLLLAEEYPDYKEGRKREKFLKSGGGRRFIKRQAGIV